MEYAVLASGSSGNSYAFSDGDDSFLIDMGISNTQLEKRMALFSFAPVDVRCIFLTHLHPDHSKGVGTFQRKHPDVPVYMSSVAFQMNKTVLEKQRITGPVVQYDFNEEIAIGSFTVTPFKTMHDSPGSAGYLVRHGNNRIFLMTDTGMITEDAFSYAEGNDVYFIEANYDADMLENGPYDAKLKKRIDGIYGHLSNSDAISFAKRYAKAGSTCIFVHLSENNNDVSIVEKEMHSNLSSGIFLKAMKRGDSYKGVLDEEG